MRRIAPLILGALAVFGPIAGASGQAQAPNRIPAPAPAPARTAASGPAPSRSATDDPAVQRAAAPHPASAPAQGSPAAPIPSRPAPAPGQAPAPLAGQQAPAADAGGNTHNAELDTILAQWEQTSGRIETLYAAFEQVDELAVVGEKKTYQGKAYLRRPNLVVLQLEKQVESEGQDSKFVFDRRILANGDEVIEFDGPLRQINIYPLPKDAQQRALEEGPLPFLFRMNVRDFKNRYRASLMPSTQEGTHRIAIYPLHPVDRDAFSVAVLILDARTLQPRSIHTLAPNGKDKQNYYIKELRANVELKPELFAWGADQARKAQQDGWRIIRNPEPQAEPASPPHPPPPGAQPQELTPIPRR
ncbi:outer-membrane lipoprotein carrier protein LolA [Tautonia sociabilis]|uniref:TIGR03009 domain-containing protein n=1 Tax=Tautonia sociabilis TaxID=2080755 RepID=A0A432MG12_9BACT|nr:outer-membrane lipoprotein carrier protein LolA [Tautonia sociabilis]RUL85291.1 hypothetical protein TsocGM_18970 [Tautonia sociabilis]